MGCPCQNPKTGEVVEVPAKTKEMVYRSESPWIKEAIRKEQEINNQQNDKPKIITTSNSFSIVPGKSTSGPGQTGIS